VRITPAIVGGQALPGTVTLPASSPVPEPGTMTLAAVAAIGLLGRRSR
jgi:hypothetical protein